MKNTILVVALLCAALTLSNCTNCSTDTANTPTTLSETPSKKEVSVPNTTDTISLETYNTWKANWSQNSNSWFDTDTLTSFTMPLIDLKEVIAEGAVKSRFYLGFKQEKKGFVAKLMVVGVDSLGEDMIDYGNGEYVYDVSSACPPFCGN